MKMDAWNGIECMHGWNPTHGMELDVWRNAWKWISKRCMVLDLKCVGYLLVTVPAEHSIPLCYDARQSRQISKKWLLVWASSLIEMSFKVHARPNGVALVIPYSAYVHVVEHITVYHWSLWFIKCTLSLHTERALILPNRNHGCLIKLYHLNVSVWSQYGDIGTAASVVSH